MGENNSKYSILFNRVLSDAAVLREVDGHDLRRERRREADPLRRRRRVLVLDLEGGRARLKLNDQGRIKIKEIN